MVNWECDLQLGRRTPTDAMVFGRGDVFGAHTMRLTVALDLAAIVAVGCALP